MLKFLETFEKYERSDGGGEGVLQEHAKSYKGMKVFQKYT